MAEPLLQSYLNNHHIKLTDDTGVDNLKKAISVVKKRLEKTAKAKRDIINFTLVALDPKISETDPVILEVEQIIIKKWATFKTSVAATKDKSTTYVRAVILDALISMAQGDANISALIWHTSRNVFSKFELGHGEAGLISNKLQLLANFVESEARKRWGLHSGTRMSKLEPMNFTSSVKFKSGMDGDRLRDHLRAAFIHSGWSHYESGGENPRPQGHNNWEWPAFAAKRSAEGISEEVDLALVRQNEALESFTKTMNQGINNYFSKLEPFLESISKSVAESNYTNNKRGELLWWKQTLCSPISNQSYRSYNSINAAILMALDLAEMVDPIYPISVDYLLRETLKDAQGLEVEKKQKFSLLFNDNAEVNQLIKDRLSSFCDSKEGRKPLIISLANLFEKMEGKDLYSETGLNSESEVSLTDFSVWLFHDLQSQKIANSK